MRKGRSSFRVGLRPSFERLEGRRMLAADFASGAFADVGADVSPVEQVQMATAEFPVEASEIEYGLTDGDSTEADATECPLDDTDQAVLDPAVMDLSDGMDGYFGTLDAENPIAAISFEAPGNGVVEIAIASSFDISDLKAAGEATVSLTDQSGNDVDFELQQSGGFQLLTVEATEADSFQLTLESQRDCSGQFQVTVGFAEFVDQHVDELGDQSTELEWSDEQSSLTGKLETPGDVDTFRFTSDAEGEISLQLDEIVDGDRVGLQVQVFDADHILLAEGSTNQMLQLTFDATENCDYFLAVSATAEQIGDYQISMSREMTDADSGTTDVPEEEADTNVDDAAEVDSNSEPMEDDCESAVESIVDSIGNEVDVTEIAVEGDGSESSEPELVEGSASSSSQINTVEEVSDWEMEDQPIIDPVADASTDMTDSNAACEDGSNAMPQSEAMTDPDENSEIALVNEAETIASDASNPVNDSIVDPGMTTEAECSDDKIESEDTAETTSDSNVELVVDDLVNSDGVDCTFDDGAVDELFSLMGEVEDQLFEISQNEFFADHFDPWFDRISRRVAGSV